MPDYKIIKCPVCGRELTRETIQYAYQDINTKEMGASEYYCYHCQHYIKLVHYLSEEDKITIITKEMRI